MIQEFFKTTIVSKYIKYLLASSPLPIYKIIHDGDTMVQGCTYAYRDKILHCTKQGVFEGALNSSNTKHTHIVIDDRLVVSDDLVCSDDAITFSYNEVAEYDVLKTFDPYAYLPGVTQQFISNVSYYDIETHKHLGNYLRYLRSIYNINLMPFYNCYAGKVTRDFQLNLDNTISHLELTKSKVLLVPIKFNKTYTVALESALPVKVKGVFFSNSLVPTKDRRDLLSLALSDKVVQYSNTSFDKPFLYTLECLDAELYAFEKHLYLAIEVPETNNSSVVVLEGDYTHLKDNRKVDVPDTLADNPYYFEQHMLSELSLLSINDGKQHPFADKLLQFLLRNTMDTREYIDDNIKWVESKIEKQFNYAGQWDIDLHKYLYNKYMSLPKRDDLHFLDITGYVDNDIEYAIRKGYMK